MAVEINAFKLFVLVQIVVYDRESTTCIYMGQQGVIDQFKHASD